MISEKDIQLELLKEIDDICIKNNLDYILLGTNGLNAFVNHSIKNGPISVSVAMTSGDVERFCDIVEKQNNPNRYAERIITERKNNPWYINYGNENTAYFNILDLNSKDHHGINVEVYPIRGLKLNKKAKDKPAKPKETGKLNKLLNRFLKSNKEKNEVKKTPTDKTYIDRWQDIQDFTTVKIINTKIKAKTLKEIGRYEVDNLQLALPKDASKFFREIFGANFKDRKIKPTNIGYRYILNPEMGYQQIIEESKDLIMESNSLNEEVKLKSAEADDDRVVLNNLWNLILMTNKQIEFTKYFDENIERLLSFDLSDKKEFDLVYKELKPVISALRKYAKLGMTFDINPETDSLIERVLIMKGNEKLVDEIKTLKDKEFFIE